jgi:hypothetical protein
MARMVRRPWILSAVTATPDERPENPTAQVIHFEEATVNDSEDTQQRPTVVGRLSDKDVWIYTIFTPEAVATFEAEVDVDMRIYEIRGGVINLVKYEVVTCTPVAMIVHEFKFIGSEGCTTFGAPTNCMLHPAVDALEQPDADEADWEPSQENSEAVGAEIMTLFSHIHEGSAADAEGSPLDAADCGGYRNAIISEPQQRTLQTADAWYVPSRPLPATHRAAATNDDMDVHQQTPMIPTRSERKKPEELATTPESPLLFGSSSSSGPLTRQSTESTGKRKRSGHQGGVAHNTPPMFSTPIASVTAEDAAAATAGPECDAPTRVGSGISPPKRRSSKSKDDLIEWIGLYFNKF